jgi:hypothetical protein
MHKLKKEENDDEDLFAAIALSMLEHLLKGDEKVLHVSFRDITF